MRFTKKGKTLYAILMAWPGREAVVKSLGLDAGLKGRVKKVELLGHKGALKFRQEAGGLRMEMPERAPCEHAYTLRITGLE